MAIEPQLTYTQNSHIIHLLKQEELKMKLVILGLIIVMGAVGGFESSTTNSDFFLAGTIAGIGLYLTYFGVKRIGE